MEVGSPESRSGPARPPEEGRADNSPTVSRPPLHPPPHRGRGGGPCVLIARQPNPVSEGGAANEAVGRRRGQLSVSPARGAFHAHLRSNFAPPPLSSSLPPFPSDACRGACEGCPAPVPGPSTVRGKGRTEGEVAGGKEGRREAGGGREEGAHNSESRLKEAPLPDAHLWPGSKGAGWAYSVTKAPAPSSPPQPAPQPAPLDCLFHSSPLPSISSHITLPAPRRLMHLDATFAAG